MEKPKDESEFICFMYHKCHPENERREKCLWRLIRMKYNKYHHSSGGFISINRAGAQHQLGMNPNKSFLRVLSKENKSTLLTLHIL